MRPLITALARPLDTESMPWIATGPGKTFRPLRFTADGWSELMRLEPGSMVALHRHTGEVHAFNLSGTREIFGTGERVGPAAMCTSPPATSTSGERSVMNRALFISRSPVPLSTLARMARSSRP